MGERDAKAPPGPQGPRLFSGIETDATGIDFVGNTFEMPLRTSRNTGVGTRVENATLPLAGRQGYKKITDGLFYHYGVFSVTGPLLKASASQKGAYEKALTQEMEGVTDDLKRMVNINAYLSGDATITTIASGTASASRREATSTLMRRSRRCRKPKRSARVEGFPPFSRTTKSRPRMRPWAIQLTRLRL